MTLKLYFCPRACSRVTLTALEEIRVEFEAHAINILAGEQKQPEYMAVHPGGKVPALVVDGEVLTENAAILIWLHATWPQAGLLPATDSPLEQARQRSDLIWCAGTVHPAVRQVRMPIRFTDADPAPVVASGRNYLDGFAAIAEARIGAGAWWYGADWSIVDSYLCWLFSTAASAGYSLDAFPGLMDMMARAQARESHQRAMARERAAEQAFG